jgi:hypothetical protein
MLEIKSQLFEVRRSVAKCSKCRKIKFNTEFDTYVYDKAVAFNPKLKELLMMTRDDDLYPRCKKCQNKINLKRLKIAENTAK